MSAPRNQSQFKTSTAFMFVKFAKGYFETASMSDHDGVMRTISSANATLGGMIAELGSLPVLTETSNEILTLLDKLNSIPSSAAKQNYELGRSQAQKPLDEAAAQETNRQKQEKELKALQTLCFDQIRALVALIKQAQNPEASSKLSDVLKAIAAGKTKLNQFINQHRKVRRELLETKASITNTVKAMGLPIAVTTREIPTLK